RRRLDKIERQIEALGERLRGVAADDVMWGMIEHQIRLAERERHDAAADVNAAARATAEHENALAHLQSVRAYRANVASNMAAFDFTEKREALEALDLRVFANGREWYAKGGIPGEGDGIVLGTYRCFGNRC